MHAQLSTQICVIDADNLAMMRSCYQSTSYRQADPAHTQEDIQYVSCSLQLYLHEVV